MNRKELLLSLFLTVVVCSATFGQAGITATKDPITFKELLRFYHPPATGSDAAILGANQQVLYRLAYHCDIGFVDDGTNYWALRTAGASDEVLREVDRCTRPATRGRDKVDRKVQTEEQIFWKEWNVMVDLIHLLWSGKDISARKRWIVAAQEYIERYKKKDRYDNQEKDELFHWLIIQVPKMEQKVSTM